MGREEEVPRCVDPDELADDDWEDDWDWDDAEDDWGLDDDNDEDDDEEGAPKEARRGSPDGLRPVDACPRR